MQVITLISDWGYRDLSLGMMKGMLYSSVDDSRIVDLYHNVDVVQRDQASFMLSHLYQKFPVGTIHISLVGVSSSMVGQPLVMQLGGYYFISFDQDTMSVLSYGREDAAEIRVYKGDNVDSLQTIANLASACVDGSWKEMCEVWEKPTNAQKPLVAQVENNQITGDIIYVDDHNNIVTDISAEEFMKKREEFQHFSCVIGTTKVVRFHTRYQNDVLPYFMPNDLGMIQIVMYGGKVTMLPRWARNMPVEISFS